MNRVATGTPRLHSRWPLIIGSVTGGLAIAAIAAMVSLVAFVAFDMATPRSASAIDVPESSIVVCVNKDVGDIAGLAGVQASDFQVALTVAMQESNPVPFGAATDACPSQLSNVAEISVPANAAQFKLTETQVPNGQPKPAGPTDIECVANQGGDVGLAALPGGPIGQADLKGGSITVPLADVQFGSIDCTFTNDSVAVCAIKALGRTASAAELTASDFAVALSPAPNGETIQGVENGQEPKPVVFGTKPCTDDLPNSQLFFVAPGHGFTLTESENPLSAPVPAGLIKVSCASGAPDGDVVRAETAESSITASPPPGATRIYCTFVNDSVRICVAKRLGETARGVGFEPKDFSVQLDRGKPVPFAENENGCHRGENEQVEFFVAPGAEFTMTETLPDDPRVGFVGVSCTGATGKLSGSGRGWTGTVDDEAISVTCTFANDSVIVCVTKHLGATAVAAGYEASDFEFSLFLGRVEIEPLETTPIECQQLNGQFGDSAYAGFAVPPTSAFEVVEFVGDGVDSSQVGPSGPAKCSGDPYQMVGPSHEGSADSVMAMAGRAGSSPVRCDFFNDSVRVCVAKRLGDTAAAVGFAASNFGVQLDRGQPVRFAENENGCGDVANEQVEFFVAPGAEFTLTESLPDDARVGFVGVSCRGATGKLSGSGRGWTGTVDKAGRSVTCAFVNDSVRVCVAKRVGSGGIAAGYDADDFSFELQIGQGTPYESGEGSSKPSRGCAVPSPCNMYDDGPCETKMVGGDFAYHEFFVAPGSEFRLSERAGFGVDLDEIGLVSDPTCSAQSNGTNGVHTLALNASDTKGSAVLVGEVSGTAPSKGATIACDFFNNSVRVCVTKSVGKNALGLGYEADDFDFDLQVIDDGLVRAAALAPGSAELNGGPYGPCGDDLRCELLVPDSAESIACDQVDDGPLRSQSTLFFVAPGARFEVTESPVDGLDESQIGLIKASCYHQGRDRLEVADVQPARGRKAMSVQARARRGAGPVFCEFYNDAVAIEVTKIVRNLEGDLEPSDFDIELYDAEGTLIDSGSPEPDGETVILYGAPGAEVTLLEPAVVGYDLVKASCHSSDPRQTIESETEINGVATTLPSHSTRISCTFVNQNLPLIPICAVQVFDPGLTDFTLADLGMELYQGGGLVASVNSAGPASPECNPTTTTAALLASDAVQVSGNEILLTRVYAADQTFQFTQQFPPNRGNRLTGVSLDCSLEVLGATQPIDAAPAVFTLAQSSPPAKVLCTAVAETVPVPARVTKIVLGGTASPSEFTLIIYETVSGDLVALAPGVLVVDDLAPGSYTVTESSSRPDYVPVPIVCAPGAGNTFVVDNNTVGPINCTLTNSFGAASSFVGALPEPEPTAEPTPAPIVPISVAVDPDQALGASGLAVTGSSTDVPVTTGLGFLAAGSAALALGARRRRRHRDRG